MVKESNVNITLLSSSHEARESVEWRGKIVPALNRAIYKLTDEDSIDSPDPMTGKLSYHPRHTSDPDLQLCIALITLYFHALECTIFQEAARKRLPSHPKIVQMIHFTEHCLHFVMCACARDFLLVQSCDFQRGTKAWNSAISFNFLTYTLFLSEGE